VLLDKNVAFGKEK